MQRGRKKWEPSAADVREIAEAMAEGNLTLTFTAAKFHMAVTTLFNRMDRIRERTGIDLRSFQGVQDGLRYGLPASRGDRFRAMTDEQIALKILSDGGDGAAVGYCRNNGKCKDIDCENEEIPDAWCVECIKRWLEEVPE